MPGLKHAVFGMVAAAAVTCAPLATADAHGFGHHPWGLGRGLFGAVLGLATLPIAIASAALSATELGAPPYQSSPGYGGPPSYAPPPAYYAPPPAYYVPPRAYYPRPPVYAPAARPYYAPRGYYAPPPGYYGGRASYGPGGHGYPRR
jgi:hypothetical protein